MRKINFELNFKKDMTNIEIEGVIAIVKNYKYNNGDLYGYDVDSGDFIYTSSSSYAMLGIDGLTYVDEESDTHLTVSHFGITENNMLIMVCHDDYENYFYYEIEAKDF